MTTASLVAGRYRLEQILGDGGQGRVWRATDHMLDRPVALKQITVVGLDGETDPDAEARMVREARAAARLHHPNIVAVHDIVQHEGQQWLVMEYVPGESLGHILERTGHVIPRDAAIIGARMADALADAHANGIVHRDIKPANVLVSHAGDGRSGEQTPGDGSVVKLADFGVARIDGDPRMTHTGAVVGTVSYLSPEVARGEPAGPASDIWSLGATLYTAVEGVTPIPSPNGNQLAQLRLIADGQVAPPRHAGPLTDVLAVLLAPDPAARPTAARAAAMLKEAAGAPATPGTMLAPPAPPDQVTTPVGAYGARFPPPVTPQPRTPQPRTPPPPVHHVPAPPRPRRRFGWLVAFIAGGFVAVAGIGVLGMVALGLLSAAGEDDPRSYAPTTCAWEASSVPPARDTAVPESEVPSFGYTSVTLNTNKGPIPMTLDRASAPCAVESFLTLARSGYYDGTTCHRLVEGGTLLCGDPTGTGTGGSSYLVPAEGDDGDDPSVIYETGSVALSDADEPLVGDGQFALFSAEAPRNNARQQLGTLDSEGEELVKRVAFGGADESDDRPVIAVTIETVTVEDLTE